MNPKELRDYILTKMTAEEALLKLLESPIYVYQHLKQGKPMPTSKEVHPEIIIAMAAMDLGWDFIIEGGEQENVRGLVTGTAEYIEGWKRKPEPPYPNVVEQKID